MKVFGILCTTVFIGILIDCIHGQCQKRDKDAAVRNDPTRKCPPKCSKDSDCSEKKTCNCDGLCGLSCYKLSGKCDPIAGSISNGVVTADNVTIGSQATYSCTTSGHILRGRSIRTCRSDRRWSHEAPQCLRPCPSLFGVPDVENGFPSIFQSDVYFPGDVVEYKCRFGYRLSGNPNRTCQTDSTWTAPQLSCIITNCGSPPAIFNGDYTPRGKTEFGTNLIYSCNKGFKANGAVGLRCTASGTWNPQNAPTCSRVECPPPPENLQNGEVVKQSRSTWRFEDSITYRCNVGYLVNGLSSTLRVICNENSTWGEIPVCKGSLNADFDLNVNGFQGYVAESGNFVREEYTQSNGVPSIAVKGTGTLRSVPFSLPASRRACVQFDYSAGPLRVESFFNGVTIELDDIPASAAWTTKKFWLLPASARDTEVSLQFVSSNSFSLDNIRVLADNECGAGPSVSTPTLAPRTSTPSPAPLTSSTSRQTTPVVVATTTTAGEVTNGTGIPVTVTTGSNMGSSEPTPSSLPSWAIAVIVVAVIVLILIAGLVGYSVNKNSKSSTPGKPVKPETLPL